MIMYLPAFPPWHALRVPRRLSSKGGAFLSYQLCRSWAACAHLPMTFRLLRQSHSNGMRVWHPEKSCRFLRLRGYSN